MKIILFIGFCFLSIDALPKENKTKHVFKDEWHKYKIQFKKSYFPEFEENKRTSFEDNLKLIQQHNLDYLRGKHSFTLGINEFSDLTHEEFKETYMGAEIHHEHDDKKSIKKSTNSLPKYIDWRSKGFVNPVESQGPCSSSYAFSSLGALEGQYFKASGKLISLSKQQIIDCSLNYGNNDCLGGSVSKTYAYLADRGAQTSEDYPYYGLNFTCRYDKSKVAVPSKGFQYISTGRETDLAEAVATYGPISAVIDGSLASFKNYETGIYDDSECSSTTVNHAVLIVGYGVENDKHFWVVKNSWGTRWGMRGYIRMSKDNNNQCGIATRASIPII